MRNRLIVLIVMLALVGLFGCSPSDPEVDDPTDTGNDDANGDASECAAQYDCADDEYCHEGTCFGSPSCPSTSAYSQCRSFFEGFRDDLAPRAYCDGEVCQTACRLDEHCPGGDVCSDNGRCIEFTGDITAGDPGGDSTAPLQAGVAETLLDFPVGLSLGGYGSRGATDDGRYVESLEASHGTMHGLTARALAVDDGTRQLVFVRAPIIFPTGPLHEAVSRRLQDETGDNWRSSLLLSGTHTHSGPARFWQLPDPDETDIPMGMFGIDEFHQQAFDWLVDSLADAALDAVDDLSPAQMGWEVVEAFDTDDAVSSDRRSNTPPFDDNRVLLIRVDDPDGHPRAVLTSFGTHGTVHSGPYANNDVIVGAENRLEFALGERFDRTVSVMYFNQNGGTMSPRGDHRGHDHTQRYESLGAELADRTIDAIDSMETTDDWSFDGHTHRFPILHEHLDYGDGEFDDEPYGGLQCIGNGVGDFGDHYAADDYGCLLGFHDVLDHRPMTLLSKSQISAIELNDLTLVTMPGELSMPLGWQVQRELRDAYDIDPFNSFTLGYAQDHLLYLLPTNLRGELPPFPGISTPQAPDDYPEYAFSYLQGGYEANMSPWGHKFGDFLVDRAVEAVGLMRGDIDDPVYEPPLPDEFTDRDQGTFPVDATDADDVGTITEQPPAEVERREFVEIAWLGGDPGAEMPQTPQVILERHSKESDQFQPVTLPSHRIYDNRQFTMPTRLRYDDADRPEWVVYWEELADFPVGTYRFQIRGQHLDASTDAREDYTATTDAFELIPSTQLQIGELEAVDAQTLSFRLSLPAADELTTVGGAGDRGQLSGSYRMHHRATPTGAPIPVDIDAGTIDVDIEHQGDAVGISDISVTTSEESVGGDTVPVTRVAVELDDAQEPGSEVELQISAFDAHENSTTASTTLEF